jgi:excisionase family DNA binding protein
LPNRIRSKVAGRYLTHYRSSGALVPTCRTVLDDAVVACQRMSSTTTQRLLTTRDVAELTQVSPRTVQRWVDHGLLPVVRINGVLRFEPQALDALIRRSRHRAEPLDPTPHPADQTELSWR